MSLDLSTGRSSAPDVLAHLRGCDPAFVADLERRVVLDGFAEKIAAHATRFEAWDGRTLAGLVAAYFNDATRRAFVTHVGVQPAWAGRGVALALMERCVAQARASGMREAALEVAAGNARAIALYQGLGFRREGGSGDRATMSLDLQVPGAER